MVYNRIKRYRGFTRLSVAYNKLALTPAYRYHTVNSHNTRLKRLVNRSSLHNGRRAVLARHMLFSFKRLAVKRSAYRVYNPAYKLAAYGHVRYDARTLNAVPYVYGISVIHKHGAYAVLA